MSLFRARLIQSTTSHHTALIHINIIPHIRIVSHAVPFLQHIHCNSVWISYLLCMQYVLHIPAYLVKSTKYEASGYTIFSSLPHISKHSLQHPLFEHLWLMLFP